MAPERRDLYPGRLDLCEKCSRQLSTRHWIGTNYSLLNIKKIIQAACEVAGINFQRGIKLLYK